MGENEKGRPGNLGKRKERFLGKSKWKINRSTDGNSEGKR